MRLVWEVASLRQSIDDVGIGGRTILKVRMIGPIVRLFIGDVEVWQTLAVAEWLQTVSNRLPFRLPVQDRERGGRRVSGCKYEEDRRAESAVRVWLPACNTSLRHRKLSAKATGSLRDKFGSGSAPRTRRRMLWRATLSDLRRGRHRGGRRSNTVRTVHVSGDAIVIAPPSVPVSGSLSPQGNRAWNSLRLTRPTSRNFDRGMRISRDTS